jgi:hypothetical protein
MKRSTLLLVGLVAFFFALPVMVRIAPVVGPATMTLIMLTFGGIAAWLGHTPETAAMAEDFKAALKIARIDQKEAAITLGISEPTLSNQLSGKEPPSRLWLGLAVLGQAFRVAFYRLQLLREECTVLERGELCDLVNAVQALTAEKRRPRVARLVRREVA